MDQKLVNSFLLLICVSLVWSSDPNSEVESLNTENSGLTNLESQVKTTIKSIQDETEKLRNFLEESKNRMANQAGSDANIHNLLEMHDRVANLTQALLTATAPLKKS